MHQEQGKQALCQGGQHWVHPPVAHGVADQRSRHTQQRCAGVVGAGYAGSHCAVPGACNPRAVSGASLRGWAGRGLPTYLCFNKAAIIAVREHTAHTMCALVLSLYIVLWG